MYFFKYSRYKVVQQNATKHHWGKHHMHKIKNGGTIGAKREKW